MTRNESHMCKTANSYSYSNQTEGYYSQSLSIHRSHHGHGGLPETPLQEATRLLQTASGVRAVQGQI